MALTKEKKNQVVKDVCALVAASKLTVVAEYKGTPVKAMQALRRQANADNTKVLVVKNRLVIKALQGNSVTKDADTHALTGMLLYAFNAVDEVAPAQVLAKFAKTQPTLQFVGGFTEDGVFIGADDVKALAALPSKEQLRGMLVGTLAAPLSGFINVMAGNVRGVLNVLSARADAISQ